MEAPPAEHKGQAVAEGVFETVLGIHENVAIAKRSARLQGYYCAVHIRMRRQVSISVFASRIPISRPWWFDWRSKRHSAGPHRERL